MRLDMRKRKSWSNASGVSEVVGNVLILLITVVLFTTIIAFVNQMPVPQSQTKASFDASISYSGTNATLTVSHAGGASLKAIDTLVVVEKDSVLSSYKLSEDTDFPHDNWVAGMDWTKELSDVSSTSKIAVRVYDLSRSAVIWVSEVSGGSSGNPPSILQRYADSDPSTPSVDPVKRGDNFTLFVYVVDLDNDLDTSSVWIDSSQIENESGVQRAATRSGGGWYEWDFVVWEGVTLMYSAARLDGSVIMIHASDDKAHTSYSSFVLSVLYLPADLYLSELPVYYTSFGESGLPSYLTYAGTRSGFGVYGEDITNGTHTGTANTSDARTAFAKGEMVFVRVGSLFMSNIFGENRMVFTDTRTGLSYTPQYVMSSTSSSPFYRYPTGGNAYVYEAKFDTTQMLPSAYTMSIYLKSTGGEVFQAHQILVISDEGSPVTFVPAVYLYKDQAHVYPWGTRLDPFVVDGETHKVYVRVKVQDANVAQSPSMAEIRISDMAGDTQLYGAPPSGTMITNLVAAADGKNYTFEMDLRINNGDRWLGGNNAYTVFMSRFADSNEGVYSLSQQIFVRASYSSADFFSGTTGVYSSQGGSQNFITPEYLYYIENNNFFTKRAISEYQHAPSTTPSYYVTAIGVGDIDSDGDLDVLQGQYDSYSLLYYENSLNTYGIWQAGATIDRPAIDAGTVIEWIACGDLDDDGDTDFAYSSSGNRVVVYNNTYGTTPAVFKTFNTSDGGVRKIDIRDMNNDGRDELIVLANGRIWMYDLSQWGRSDERIARLPDKGSHEQFPATAVGIVDFDIEDMNGDGWLDILTVGDSGSITGAADVWGVWVNNYSANANPTVKKLTTVYTPEKGQISDADVTLTHSDDGGELTLRENGSSESLPRGALDARMKFETLDTSAVGQTLYVRARTSGDGEAFYAWYSVDGTIYTLMFQISSTTETNYSFPLPSTVASTQMYLRFTDSLATSGSASPVDYLYVDYVGVFTKTFGAYTSARYQVTSDTTFECVRGGNLTGNEQWDVVIAKKSYWYAYNELNSLLWSGSNTYFYVTGIESFHPGIAPTLFDVVDVNGDGYYDILWTNSSSAYTGPPNTYIHKFGMFVNLYPSLWCVTIKDLYAGLMDPRGSITVTLAVDLSPEA